MLAMAPAAGAQPDSVTATGTGQGLVQPRNRHDNASIVAAYDAAKHAAIAGAIRQARAYANDYASALGLRLGPVTSVSDVQGNGFYGPYQYAGPFGPNQFCGTVRQPILKAGANGRRKVVGTRKRHRCFVPRYAYTTLTITYSTT
jgi:hypothetical protein